MFAEQLSKVPVVNMLLGSVVGIGAAKAVLGHFSVMVRDIAQLFVAGPPVVRHAMGYDIAKEDLGDWRVHCRNGSVDNLADSEEAAAARFGDSFPTFRPASTNLRRWSAPDSGDPPDRHNPELRSLIPRRRTMTFDVRRAIELMADDGSFFEIGPLWGTDQVVGFVRFNGHPLGVLASDSRHVNGGAMTADGCRKLTRHLDLCDLFHIPILNLIDNPGFAVGLEHEVAGTIRAGGEWMVAFAQITVPIFTVVMRRSFGVAGNNFATPQAQASVRVAWPAADVGGIPPEGGIEAAYKRQLAEAADPEAFRAETERSDRERARPARTPLPVPDRGDDRSRRDPPHGVRVGTGRLPGGEPAGVARPPGHPVPSLRDLARRRLSQRPIAWRSAAVPAILTNPTQRHDPGQHDTRERAMSNLTEHIRAWAGSTRAGTPLRGERYSHAEVYRQSSARAALLADLELGRAPPRRRPPRERPRSDLLAAGGLLAGATVVGLNSTRSAPELLTDIEHTDCRLIVTDQSGESLLRGAGLELPSCVVDSPDYFRGLSRHPARTRPGWTCPRMPEPSSSSRPGRRAHPRRRSAPTALW